MQSANYASLRDGRLTLEGLGEVGWFSDRPYREAGRVATRDFIRAWQAGQNSFAENPPNASLVCAIDFEDVDFFVELSDPAFDERMGVLSYGVRAIGDGVLPTAFDCDGGTAHLFIDALRGDET